jgi:hypothetical protein
MAEGEFALVKHHLEAAIQKPNLSNDALDNENEGYAMLADLAVQQRDEAGLRHYAPLIEEVARRDGHKLYQAIAHRAWGVAHRLAGEYDAATIRLNQALELFQALDTRWQIGRTLSELGKLADARAETAAARDYFSRALAAFEDMKAAPDAARVRAALETLN